MPGFVSHTVMAKDVYKRINNKNVNLDYMVTYSLGGDLTKYSKCRYNTHHKDRDKFIYYLADYIKNNNLTNDSELMGVLYGHICHYVMDDIIHPLVRKIDKECIKDKHNHTLIEEYYDTYLVKLRYMTQKRKYLSLNKLNGSVNKKISKMLDYGYTNVYHTKNIGMYYKFNLLLYRLLIKLYLIFDIDKISGLNKFLNKNYNIDLYNDNNIISYNDYLGYKCSDSLSELYSDSINIACEYIDKIDKYLTNVHFYDNI